MNFLFQMPPHLLAAAIAIVVALVGVEGSMLWCRQLEREHIHALALELSPEKLQGAALQKQAFNEPALLVLYGSSELVRQPVNNASRFFEDYPTGFRVFPIGKPGAASLAAAQKIAAVGEDIRGKKVAYSISPGWFFKEVFDPSYYEGGFSELQANELAFSTQLSSGLKRDIARRMLDFPKTLEHRPVLDFALTHLAGDSCLDQSLYALCWPIGRLQVLINRRQDHAEVALHILEEDENLHPPIRGLRGLNWNEVLKRAAKFANSAAIQAKKNEVAASHLPKASRDKVFLQTLEHAREWTDFELLLRTWRELDAKPLLLSMPVEDIRLEVYGISQSSRDAYLHRLNRLAAKYQVPLADFRDHQTDNGFLVDFLDHLSSEGWLYYNKVLDDFYHDRLAPSGSGQ